MSLAAPVEISPIKPNGQLCGSDGGTDYTIIPTGHVQVMGFPHVPGGTRVPSPFSAVSSVYLPVQARIIHQVDEAAFSKNVICPNIRLQHPSPCSVSTPRYVGLPYQDHNYVQLPPSTPPLSPSLPLSMAPMPKATMCIVDDVSCNTTVITTDDSITRCICEFQHDDGYMIQCDRCGVWQHVDCMEVDRDNIPDSYMCEVCEPRRVDKHRAIQIQTRKRDALSLQHMDSSATETEDETTDGRRRSFDKSPFKKEIKDNGCSSSLGTLVLNKKRKTKSKRDERLKRKLQLKRPSNGQKPPVGSPKKAHFEPMMIDGLGETVKQEAALPQNGALVMPISSLNTNPPCIEIYQEAASNCYTMELQNLLASIKFNGQQVAACSPSVYEKLQFGPSCVVAAVSSTRMGLEACEDILTNEPLIEYVGRVMLRDQYDKDNLFYHRAEPNVLFYSKLGGLDLCIDASLYGNMARFVRRSCTPNAEVRHLLEGSAVRFFLCATKSIVRGAEITIPFDFNYHKCGYLVDCACTRVSCPVAKFQRREASHSSGPAARRQRTARSLEVMMHHQEHGVLSPKKMSSSSSLSSSSSSLLTLVKHSKQPVLTSLENEAVAEIEIKKEPEIKIEPSMGETVPVSPIRQLAAPSAPTVTASDNESYHPALAPSSCGSHCDPDENDKSKKKTREEKKLEMVMKMFERMAKQEERKKEAQSRMEHTTKVKEPTIRTKEPSRKSRESRDSRSTSESMTADMKQLPTADTPSFMVKEQVEPALPEVPVKTETKAKVKRSKHGTSSRRSSMSVVSSTGVTPSSILPSALMPLADVQPVCSSVVTSPADHSLTSVPFSAALTLASASEAPTAAAVLDRWTVHPKKLLMRGQELGKQLIIKTEGLDLGGSESEFGTEFVQCVPSPHSCSLNNLRRNSLPATNGCSNGSASGIGRTASLSTPTPQVSSQSESKGCSAKKRWLHQAMCDKTELQPIDEDSLPMPGRHPATASISPTDFVTPLKKRRLARESLSTDSPPPPLLTPVTNAPGSNLFPQYESISDDEHTDVELMQSRELVHDAKSNDSSYAASDVVRVSKDLTTDDVFKPRQFLSGDIGSKTLLNPPSMGNLMLMQAVGSYQCHGDDGRSLREEIATTANTAPTHYNSGTDRSDKPMSDSLNTFNNVEKKDHQLKTVEPSVQLVSLYNPLASPHRLGAVVQGMQAWQNSGLSTSVSGINSTLSAATLYSRPGLLPGLKDNSMSVHRFFNYGPLRLSVDKAVPEYAVSSGLKTTPLTVGINSGTGLSNAVYLSKQILGQTLDVGSSSASGSIPTSMFHPVSTPQPNAQGGLLSLVEAALQSEAKAAKEAECQNAPVQNWLRNSNSEEYRQNGDVSSATASSYASFTWASSEQSQKIRNYFHSSLQPTFQSAAVNSESNILPTNSSNPVVSYSSFSGVPSVQVSNEGSTSTTDWTQPPSSNGSLGETGTSYVSVSKGELLTEHLEFTSAGSFSNASQSSTGLCHLKKKVTLDEYKMRRKSGGTSASRLSSGSGSADSDTSLPLLADAALFSPPLRPASGFPATVPDANRDMLNGLNLDWNTDATAAEKTLEKLQTSEKHFKPEKGEVASTEPYLLITRDSPHHGSIISPIHLLTTAARTCVTSAESDTTGHRPSPVTLTTGDGIRSSNVYISVGQGGSFPPQQPVNICDTVPASLLGKGLAPQLPPMYLLTTTRSSDGHVELNAQAVQTSSSNITGNSNCPSLVQR